MARYVLSHRRAGKFGEAEHLQTRATLGAALRRMEAEVNVLRDFAPEDPMSAESSAPVRQVQANTRGSLRV